MNNKGYAKNVRTPLPQSKKAMVYEKDCLAQKAYMSDSEESTASSTDAGVTPQHTGAIELSIVAEFDDLIRLYKQRPDSTVEDAFYSFVEQAKEMIIRWRIATEESRRLQLELDKKNHELGDFEHKLKHARKLFDQQKKQTRQAEEERDQLEAQISTVRDVLTRDCRNDISDEAKRKLEFLNCKYYNNESLNGRASSQLSAIPEINSTGSLLSDFSYSRSEDDLDATSVHNGLKWKKHRPSMDNAGEPAIKKRRSSENKVVEISKNETVRATTTLTLTKDGPIQATSVIESVPVKDENKTPGVAPLRPTGPSANLIYDLWQASAHQGGSPNLRQHNLHAKTIVMPDTCGPCEKRIGFAETALKCKNCRTLCHTKCKDNLPLPCIPCVNTPTQKNATGTIGDYTPLTSPMVPALIVHCLNEIEEKGLNELGIYRIPGSEKDVKTLKEKFLRGKGAPPLNQVDVHVICGTVKDFLRSLSEPLVTYAMWPEFVNALQAKNQQDIAPTLCQLISELPQSNRDTLAYMILHLKKVAKAKECKMPTSNLAKIFGPTIVGYSSAEPVQSNLISETRQQVLVMEHLLNLPLEFWMSFVTMRQNSSRLQQTPSTDSLLRPTTRGFLTPSSGRNLLRKKPKKFLPTPTALLT